jgi:carboxylesterase
VTEHAHLDPRPFFLEGGPVGVLLIHGLTGAPPEVRPVADYLHRRGFTVSGPLLPGHGTSLADLHTRRWTEWTACAEQALAELQARCQTVFVGGLSMGSLLSIYLAAHHPEIAGAMLYSPAVRIASRLIYLSPFAKYIIRSQAKGPSDLVDPQADRWIWSYDNYSAAGAHQLLLLIQSVRRLLPGVTCPLLIIYSTSDRAIHSTSARYTYERAGSTDKELVTLHSCGHCITVDGEWETVAEKSFAFIQQHLKGAPDAS